MSLRRPKRRAPSHISLSKSDPVSTWSARGGAADILFMKLGRPHAPVRRAPLPFGSIVRCSKRGRRGVGPLLRAALFPHDVASEGAGRARKAQAPCAAIRAAERKNLEEREEPLDSPPSGPIEVVLAAPRAANRTHRICAEHVSCRKRSGQSKPRPSRRRVEPSFST
jgi:hypothetical protein